ncbi:methyltransferase [Caldalkalibacillus salinus]|uniref:methyltransferase n=1 Tax=Caldalkalibacillus salinus TaxID=2803787 RepID=UPI001921A50A
MADHYYTKHPRVKSAEEMISVNLRSKTLTLYTDSGVFSKKGVDYGSKLLVEHIEAGADAKILDIGCGYGTIGLTLAKEMSSRKVTLVDVNERAVLLSKKNADQNNIANVSIFQSDLFHSVQDRDYDMIVSNPPIRAGKRVVHALLEEGYDYLSPTGELWIVIQKKQGAASALKKLEEIYSQVQEVTKNKGYRIYQAKKG